MGGRRWFALLALAPFAACAGDEAGISAAMQHGDAGAIADAVPPPADASAAEAPADGMGADAAPPVLYDTISATNPVLGPDHADPHVLRTVDAQGRATYFLTATAGNEGEIGLHTSTDLIHWVDEPVGLFQRPHTPGDSVEINGGYFCDIWAPQMVAVRDGVVLLSFSATRYATAQSPCPPYHENGGVWLASAVTPRGPFARAETPWEPLPAGASTDPKRCTSAVRGALPRSFDTQTHDCAGGPCQNVMRLDSDVFHDPKDDRFWMSYSWFTNSPPVADWEHTNAGEHLSITELDPNDPFVVRCDAAEPILLAINPHDQTMSSHMMAACPRCGEQFSFTRARDGSEIVKDGVSWGVAEGANVFRHGDYVYLLGSGSSWDSAFYQVFWAAAKSVPELAGANPNRLLGRFIIPSRDRSFGHGTATLGPDGESLYFVHHRLDHGPCAAAGACARDVWVTPIEFEDHGDGKGAVYITPRFPAEDPTFSVRVPR